MKLPDLPSPVLLAAGALVALAAYVALRGPRAAGEDVGGAAVDVVGGAATGAVVRFGEWIGIPPTDATACARARAEGRTFDASLACPAPDFFRYLWT